MGLPGSGDMASTGLQTPPSYVDSTVSTYASRNASGTYTAPTGIQDGDLILFLGFYLATAATALVAGPAGFTRMGTAIDATDGGNNGSFHAFYKKASSESGDYAFTHNGTINTQAMMAAYRGVDWSTPFDVSAEEYVDNGDGSDTLWTFTGITTVNDNCKIIEAAFNWGDTGNDLSPPTGFTEREDLTLLYLSDRTQAVAGDTGTVSNTSNANVNNPRGGYLIALRAAA